MNLLMISGDATIAQGHQGAFFEMLRRFSRYWGRIDVLTPRAPGASARTLHANVYVHPASGPKLLQPRFIRRVGAALLAERDYALITSHDFGVFYNGIGAAFLSRQTGIPYVSELHHVEGYPRAASPRERLYRLLALLYIRRAKKRVAAFRVVNHVEMPELLRRLGVPDEQILVLPSLYVDFNVFRPLADVPPDYDGLFVGRLAPNKGLPTLMAALARLKVSHPNFLFGIHGRGPMEDFVRQQIAACGLVGNVRLTTRAVPQGDLVRLYNSAAMLVCASTAEGGPRVTVEAMACGVPVVTTPVGMMRELITDGDNGLLFEWDAAALHAQMAKLLDDEALRQQIAARGRESVQEFRADTVIDGYARGYYELIARLKGETHAE